MGTKMKPVVLERVSYATSILIFCVSVLLDDVKQRKTACIMNKQVRAGLITLSFTQQNKILKSCR